MIKHSVIGLFLASAISGCTTSSTFHQASEKLAIEQLNAQKPLVQSPTVHYDLFSPVDISKHQVFELTQSQKDEFFAYFEDPTFAELRPHKRVANYLLTLSDNFTYREKTFNASQALDKEAGNCMSLAIVSTAIANLVGLDYYYREIHSAPVFSETNNLQSVSTHVNLTLVDKTSSNESPLGTVSIITIDYFRESSQIGSSRVSASEVEIMYWHNLAAEALLDGNVDLAFAFTIKANEINPMHPETLNLLAILYGRKGETNLAYAVYDFMDTHQIATFTGIDNFTQLLKQRGDYERAAKLSESIASITESNPYTWINRGKVFFEQGQMRLAEKSFTIATQRAKYLHEPHFFLAQIYAQQSKLAAAYEALEKAESLAYLPGDELRYRAKRLGLLDH